MNQQLIHRLADLLRDNSHVNGQDRASLLLLLLVWVARLDADKSNSLDWSLQKLNDSITSLVSSNSVLARAFLDTNLLQNLNPVVLMRAVDEVRRFYVGRDDLVAALKPVELPNALGLPHACDPTVADLIGQLVCPRANEQIYAPWDQTGQISAALTGRGARVVVETPDSPLIVHLLGMLYDSPWQIENVNPILDVQTRLNSDKAKYSAAAAILPMGMRVDSKRYVFLENQYIFPEKTNSGAVLGLRQLLAVTKGRIVVAVQNSVLFSSGAEHNLRQDILQRGILVAVIAMPAGLLSNGTMGPFTILVLDPVGGQQSVRFVNADSKRFKMPVYRNRYAMTNVEELVRIINEKYGCPEAATVSAAELLSNDAQLQVSRYVIPESTANARKILEASKTVALEDLVVMIRPPVSVDQYDEEDEEAASNLTRFDAFEVSAADLPQYGYITQPGRQVTVAVSGRTEEQVLKKYDIVLFVKGGVGKVGIFHSNPNRFFSSAVWIAGQSAIVLRMRDNAVIDARALFMQLRSPFGQELLKSIVSGATVPLIQLKELKRLRVIMPDKALQRLAINALEEEAEYERDISSLREKQAALSVDLWNLS